MVREWCKKHINWTYILSLLLLLGILSLSILPQLWWLTSIGAIFVLCAYIVIGVMVLTVKNRKLSYLNYLVLPVIGVIVILLLKSKPGDTKGIKEIKEDSAWVCPECGVTIRENDKFCPKCGIEFEE